MIDRNIGLSAMEWLAIFVGTALMLMLAFTTAAPYVCAWSTPVCKIPPDLVRQIDQTQNTIQNLALILFGFLFGASVGTRMKDATIDTLAKTAQTAGAALSPPPEAIVLKPGESATATATADGTEIKPDP